MSIKKPWLFLPPQLAHDLAPLSLQLISHILPQCKTPWKELTWQNLTFKNPIGTAGGIDKNAKLILPFFRLGAGFVEVGTLTPLPQKSNSKPILLRNIPQQSLWNKMGFPNSGMLSAKNKLLSVKTKASLPIFVNIGKNRSTPNNKAHQDYIQLIQTLSDVVDVFVINISSPNTKDLRALLSKSFLSYFLSRLVDANVKKIPLLLKVSPDLEKSELADVLEASIDNNIDGWILTNTSTSRPSPSPFPSEGGLSGQLLAKQSKRSLQWTIEMLGHDRQNKLIVSVGGILSLNDVLERLELGADLTQVYSALIFKGPRFFYDCQQEFLKSNSFL